MSIHPSLVISDKDKKPRSVLKRSERLRILLEKGQWQEGKSIYGLPKIKTVRMKIKKETPKEATSQSATENTASGETQKKTGDKK